MRSFITPFRWRRLISQKIQATKSYNSFKPKITRQVFVNQAATESSLSCGYSCSHFRICSAFYRQNWGIWRQTQIRSCSSTYSTFSIGRMKDSSNYARAATGSNIYDPHNLIRSIHRSFFKPARILGGFQTFDTFFISLTCFRSVVLFITNVSNPPL